MAPKPPQQESVIDGLRSIYGQIADLELAPDASAHGQFLEQLRGAIRSYVTSRATAAVRTPMAGGMPTGPGAGPGGPAGPAMQPPPRIPGGATPNPLSMPNPEELRRVLSMNGAGGA